MILLVVTTPYLVERYLSLTQHREQQIVVQTENQKYLGVPLDMIREESDTNEYDYDLQVILSIASLTTFGYPDDMDQIGTPQFRMFEFEFDPNYPEATKESYLDISSHICTAEDFEEASANVRIEIVGTTRANALCIDKGQNLTMVGIPSAYVKRSLVAEIVPCKGSNCYNTTYAKERLEGLTFNLAFTNQKFLVDTYLPNDVVEMEFYQNWYYAGDSVSVELTRNTLILHDDVYNPYGWEEERVFINQKSTIFSKQIIPGSDNLFTAVFFLNTSGVIHARFNYTLLSFIGDVGALFGTLQGICAFIMFTIFRLGVMLDNFLISNVFRTRDGKGNIDKVKMTYYGWFRYTTYGFFYKCFSKQLKKYRHHYDHRTVTRDVGMRRIERELDIVHFLRKQLILNAIIKAITT